MYVKIHLKVIFVISITSTMLFGCVNSTSNIKTQDAPNTNIVATSAPIAVKPVLKINDQVSNIEFQLKDGTLFLSLTDFLKSQTVEYSTSDNSIRFTIGNNNAEVFYDQNYVSINGSYYPTQSKVLKDFNLTDENYLKQIFNISAIDKKDTITNITFDNGLGLYYKKMKPHQPSKDTEDLWNEVINNYNFIDTIKPLEELLKKDPHDVLAQRLLAEDYESTAMLDATYVKNDPSHKAESERRRLIAAKYYQLFINYDYADVKINKVNYNALEIKSLIDTITKLMDFNKSIVPVDRVRYLILYGKPDSELTSTRNGQKYTVYSYRKQGKKYLFDPDDKLVEENSYKF